MAPIGYHVYRDGGLINDGSAIENLAVDRAASASEYHETSVPARAVDGDQSTWWCPFSTPSGTARGSAWLSADLGEAQTVSSVHIEWLPYKNRAHRIEAMQDGVWVTVAVERDAQSGSQDQPAQTSVKWLIQHNF